jgi:hypothetical protein
MKLVKLTSKRGFSRRYDFTEELHGMKFYAIVEMLTSSTVCDNCQKEDWKDHKHVCNALSP